MHRLSSPLRARRSSARHVQETFDNTYFSDGGAGYPGYAKARSFASAVAAMLASSPVIFPREGCWTWAARRDSSSAGSLIAAGRGGVWSRTGRWSSSDDEWVGARVRHPGGLSGRGAVRPHRHVAVDDAFVRPAARVQRPPASLSRAASGWSRRSTAQYNRAADGQALARLQSASVLHWFSPAVLRLLLARYGLEQVSGGRAPKSISAAHAKSILRFQTGRQQRRAAGGAVHPRSGPGRIGHTYPGDDIYWALFRKCS